ncbi:MAG: hypothetical protein QW350_04145 [Candidatus Aenigmatarchaeota archaeon]
MIYIKGSNYSPDIYFNKQSLITNYSVKGEITILPLYPKEVILSKIDKVLLLLSKDGLNYKGISKEQFEKFKKDFENLPLKVISFSIRDSRYIDCLLLQDNNLEIPFPILDEKDIKEVLNFVKEYKRR